MPRVAISTLLVLFCCASASDKVLSQTLDFPILFNQRPNYQGIHIYDTCYKWYPGGGIYVLENPSDPPAEHRVRAVIDANTPETLGGGVYSDPELSYDARRVLFCHKPTQGGSTSIYEIGIDGTGLRRVTNPEFRCETYHGSEGGVHDLTPAYLPDGRIVFTSTRWNGLVPCANKGVAILHVMQPDGTDIHPISVNSETEFDPSVMVDGRILFGRWEYIDKTALTQQSLWTVYPDGTNETAQFANNMVFPEAILDARQVLDEPRLICGSFTPHNSTPRGCIAMINTAMGKNDPAAIFNFDTPDQPTNNRGNSCEPWPLSADTVLYSTMLDGKNVVMLAHRNADDSVTRTLVYRDEIDCHTPIPVRPRPLPALRPESVDRSVATGAFYVQDIYEGMPEVPRGSITQLRVIEETSRVSPSPGGSIYNQTFSVSAALAFACKNYLGVVPVEPEGSAYFEVPAGKAIYLQALDAEGRCVRSMRTFIQASPGTTRSCIGCHEDKQATYAAKAAVATLAQQRAPSQLEDESWGTGPMDYASMVQPILDKHCVSCHGGADGIEAGLDLTGGWTDFFTISYENLTSRREVQYKSTLIAGIDCMNGTALYSAQILPAYGHGSSAAPLAKVLIDGDRGHEDGFPAMSRAERDLLLAWIDSNGLFNGTWDYTEQGCRLDGWQETKAELIAEMAAAGCTECHDTSRRFEADWFNLQRPEFSRILRAPLPAGADGYGLGLCRNREIDPDFRRLRIMSTGRYQHAVMPLGDFPAQQWQAWDPSGDPVVAFASTADPTYQRMLRIVRLARARALASPRVDMPGAMPLAGESRQIYPIPIPKRERLSPFAARQLASGEIELTWPRSRHTWGLAFDVYRGDTPNFEIGSDTLLAPTKLCSYIDDDDLQPGKVYYAIVCDNGRQRSGPLYTSLDVGPVPPPDRVTALVAQPGPGTVRLSWNPLDLRGVRYAVVRAVAGSDDFQPISAEPVSGSTLVDFAFDVWAAGRVSDVARAGTEQPLMPTMRYRVCAVNRRGVSGEFSEIVESAPGHLPLDPIFETTKDSPDSIRSTSLPESDGEPLKARLTGSAAYADGVFQFPGDGHVSYPHSDRFNLGSGPGLTVECRVCFTGDSKMPVVVSAGHWRQAGWFLQQIGNNWRWHIGGVDCDGGRKPQLGEWTRLRATWDGSRAQLFQDETLVADVPCRPQLNAWPGPMMIGQYTGGPSVDYQVIGKVSDVKIYARAVSAER